MNRKPHFTLSGIAVAAFLCILFVLTFRNPDHGAEHPLDKTPILVNDNVLHGVATAPKLENATLKAELGNAAWKVLHTMMAKFPDEPTEEDSSALKSYIHLFARLYPCGDCARHFQGLLKKYPPQVATRSTAAAWACHVHNEVNKRLKKKIFDCSKIGDFYDCGCAEDDEPGKKGEGKKGEGKAEVKKGESSGFTPLELDKEG
ncbi:hypothetical protein DSL72_008095 [Monilinia vaccinii-corymbosi]|uniref:Sulfhydryl oxidase n=1 Tax=Monilinia vaccinii-corymbosi TaxID=61207 RepID=A0A8A3PJZ5_9HELO|nr:hypothetical protein DSL72_008095 [Monilinia vaccinii-corymbosi]